MSGAEQGPPASPADADQPASPTEADRLARAALSRLAEPGDAELFRLVTRYGAADVLDAIHDATLPSKKLAHYRSRTARTGSPGPGRDLAVADRLGIRLVCPGDLEWPSQLGQLPVPPLALWVRGEPDLRRWALRSLAVVGARACTAYGQHVTTQLAGAMAERGWTIVSGAAYGIDAAAHRGALDAGGQSIAVLACGVDVAYPRSHEALLARIGAEGLIVSELAPGSTVTKPRFLERNRVIAALTRGTVVVEAAIRSGALSTAARARDLQRPVMAVPGPVTSPMSAGCHELVRVREASLVSDAADVLDLVGLLGVDAAPARRGEERPGDHLDPETLRVLEALPSRRSASVDQLVATAGLDVLTVLRGLATLSELGLAQARDAQWRLRADRRD